MDWKDLGKKVISVGAPLLGTVLLGPAGGAIGAAVGSLFGVESDDPEAIIEAIAGDPEARAKLLEFQLAQQVELRKLAVQQAEIESAERMNTISEVNKTMRAESKSEHWMQYSWRPFNGFMLPISIILIYFWLPLIGKTVPDVPQWIWILWVSVLGVATYGRNQTKQQMLTAITGQQPQPGLIGGVIQAIKK